MIQVFEKAVYFRRIGAAIDNGILATADFGKRSCT